MGLAHRDIPGVRFPFSGIPHWQPKESIQYVTGPVLLTPIRVDSAQLVDAGDLVYLATDDVRRVSQISWNSSLAQTQADLAEVFAGIAWTSSGSGETEDVVVDISPMSIYEVKVASAAYEFGAPLGPDKAAGNALLDDTLEAAVEASSIARCVEMSQGSSVTTLRVCFASQYFPFNTNGALG